MSIVRPVAVVAAILLSPALANAQGGGIGGGGIGGGGIGGGGGGFQQTGQLTSAAAIQRGSGSSFLSVAGSFLSPQAGAGVALGGGGGGGLGAVSGIANSAFGRGLGGGLGGFGGRGGFGNQFNTGFNNNNTATGQQLRVPVTVGFEAVGYSATKISADFARRLTRIPALDLKTPVAVKMDGRTVVLQGVVSSERQRDLIARLALLEPGISRVRNELAIDNAAPAPIEVLPDAPMPSASGAN